MSLVPPVLNPSSLYKEEAKRDATRIRIYNGVLSQIYNKIKAVARIAGNEKTLWYVVPEFLPGFPRFDTGEAVLYLVWNLRNAGYTVEYTHPNLLYITWKLHDERYHKTESPWSQVLQLAKSKKDTPKEEVEKPIEIKRKSILKKTTEYQPQPEKTTYSSLYPQSNPTSNLPGQLSEKHISFV
jgi:hypothetical protein